MKIEESNPFSSGTEYEVFLCKQIVTEKYENGNVKYWHKCTSFILTEGSK